MKIALFFLLQLTILIIFDLFSFFEIIDLQAEIKILIRALNIYCIYLYSRYIGLKFDWFGSNRTMLFTLSIILILISFWIHFDSPVSVIENGVFLLVCLGVGFYEEAMLRVFLFEGIRQKMLFNLNNKTSIIVITSAVFAIMHYINILNEGTFFSVTNQVFFAFGMGCLFQSLLIRYKSYVLVGTIHGLVNYFGSFHSTLLEKNTLTTNLPSDLQSNIWSLFMIVVINILFVFPLCYVLLAKSRKSI
jgi:hypothetical protein